MHPMQTDLKIPVAKFIVPEWGIYLTPVWGCRNGLLAYVAWRAGTTTYNVGVNFISHSGTMNLATG